MLNNNIPKYKNSILPMIIDDANKGNIDAKKELIFRSPFYGKAEVSKADAILYALSITQNYPNDVVGNSCRAIYAFESSNFELVKQCLISMMRNDLEDFYIDIIVRLLSQCRIAAPTYDDFDESISKITIIKLLNKFHNFAQEKEDNSLRSKTFSANMEIFLYYSLINKTISPQISNVVIKQIIEKYCYDGCDKINFQLTVKSGIDSPIGMFVVYFATEKLDQAKKFLNFLPLEYLNENREKFKEISNNILDQQQREQFNGLLVNRYIQNETEYSNASTFIEKFSDNFHIEIPALDRHIQNLFMADSSRPNLSIFPLQKRAFEKLQQHPNKSQSEFCFVSAPTEADKTSLAIIKSKQLLEKYWDEREKRKFKSVASFVRFFPGEVLGNGDMRLNYIKEAQAIAKKLDVKEMDVAAILNEFKLHIQTGKEQFPAGVFSDEMLKTFAVIENILQEVSESEPVNNNTLQLVG